jgi:hypothetical protein
VSWASLSALSLARLDLVLEIQTPSFTSTRCAGILSGVVGRAVLQYLDVAPGDPHVSLAGLVLPQGGIPRSNAPKAPVRPFIAFCGVGAGSGSTPIPVSLSRWPSESLTHAACSRCR